jgi:cystathionine beta-lyase
MQMQSSNEFKELPDRRQTGSLKWDRYKDTEVLPMWVADMDFKAAQPIQDALMERVKHGVYGYTIPYTSVEDAVMDYLEQAHGLKIKREWLVWMPGLVPALNTASRAYEKPGDAVLTNTPVYPPFLTAPEWQDKELQAVPLKVVDGRYTFDFEAMEAAVTERTKLFILCNPHNPVGRAWNLDELKELIAFCKKHELIVVSDEIHCDLILDKSVKHHTFLSVDEWAYDNSLTMMAPSKTFNVPGLSCSFIIIPNPSLRVRFQRASRGMITEINCLGYTGCEAAYRHGGEWLEGVLDVLRGNYELARSFVNERMPKLRLFDMEATYLAWIDARDLGVDSPQQFFEENGVGLSAGTLFGTPGFVRLNIGCPREMLQCALERMEAAYHKLEA